MNRLQLIVNSAMRLEGANEVELGTYVVADEWSVKEVLGRELKVLNHAIRSKGIAVNYVDRKIVETFKLNSAEMERIKNLSRHPYNRDVGYYWGAECLVEVNGELLQWFFCTDSLRKMIPHATNLLVTSELVERYKFWKPVIVENPTPIESELALSVNGIRDWISGLNDF